jgi:L-ascorbate metabolism protein UlaG (beta-lactamase superfamily)
MKNGIESGVPCVLLMVFLYGCSYYKGPVSDHYNGTGFLNEQESDNTFLDHLKWLWELETVEWPEWIDDPLRPPPPSRAKQGELQITYINHATMLIQAGEVNILTDPIWSERAGPLSWVGAKRVRSPGVSIENLPKIDIILISHDHYDHLDFSSLRRLVETHHPILLAGLGVKSRLESLGENDLTELDWWQEYTLPTKGMEIVFVPSRHNSGRGIFDGNKTLWGGFVIKTEAGNVLFQGDTAFGDFFEKIHKKFGPIRLAILPIGSYEKRWFMKTQHMNPDDAVLAHKVLGATQSVGIHFGTFSEHPEQTIDAHVKDLGLALEKHSVPETEFWIPKFGEGRCVP